VSSSIRRPKEETGRAFNHAPDSPEEALKILALEEPLEACSKREVKVAEV
jgi:hypothetical protein